MNILEKITAHKKEEILISKKKISVAELRDSEYFHRQTLSLKTALKTGTGIISEYKRKSPSKGIINDQANVLAVTGDYQRYGASAVSILTDPFFFGGTLQDITIVRNSLSIPVLRKDFMIDEYQFHEAKASGADAVLLIAACLSPAQTVEFLHLAQSLDLEILLEIHTEEELKHINSEMDLIGINNRNLKDFKVDLQHSVRLKNLLPKNTISIAESGIYNVPDFKFLKQKGFDGFLMGEYFMRNENPGKSFQEFVLEIKN